MSVCVFECVVADKPIGTNGIQRDVLMISTLSVLKLHSVKLNHDSIELDIWTSGLQNFSIVAFYRRIQLLFTF